MSNVFKFARGPTIPDMLRGIADSMEKGEVEADNLTLIAGTQVFHLVEGNPAVEEHITECLWNLEFAKTVIMSLAVGVLHESD